MYYIDLYAENYTALVNFYGVSNAMKITLLFSRIKKRKNRNRNGYYMIYLENQLKCSAVMIEYKCSIFNFQRSLIFSRSGSEDLPYTVFLSTLNEIVQNLELSVASL